MLVWYIDMSEMMYGNCMHIDIIVHDALVICMSKIVCSTHCACDMV